MTTESQSSEIVARIVPDPADELDRIYEIDEPAGDLPLTVEPDVYQRALLRWSIDGRDWAGCCWVFGSDCCGELIESCRHTQTLVASFDTEYVVAAPQILNERMTTNHD